jgi:hypothetical protein
MGSGDTAIGRAITAELRSRNRSTLRSSYARVLVWCKACRHQREADLQVLVDSGHGDVPLIKLRFWCSNCGSRLTDWVVTAKNTGPSGRR